jgi:uncharacterized protein (UPF0262 family)
MEFVVAVGADAGDIVSDLLLLDPYTAILQAYYLVIELYLLVLPSPAAL